MRQHIEARLARLRDEYEAGQQMLAELESKQLELGRTLLRISGAIQVLEELRATDTPDGNAAKPNAATLPRRPSGAPEPRTTAVQPRRTTPTRLHHQRDNATRPSSPMLRPCRDRAHGDRSPGHVP
ncbi:hypothetical protein ABZ840_01870 [Streptomyces sp. NPDC047117]|uniref:hypothetical protein n=1 Tax=Streptomyces sp. NPDC047117 TaxID=3155379 RepID=UPI0033DB3B49